MPIRNMRRGVGNGDNDDNPFLHAMREEQLAEQEDTRTPVNDSGAPPYVNYGEPQGMPVAPLGLQAEPQDVQEEAVAAVQTGEYPLNLPYPGCPFTVAVKRFFQNYTVMSGRASRSEYWWVVVFTIIVNMVFGMLTSIITMMFGNSTSIPIMLLGVIMLVFDVAMIIPCITILVRRAHDANFSGWWVLGYYLLNIAAGGMMIVGITQMLASSLYAALGGTPPDAQTLVAVEEHSVASMAGSSMMMLGVGSLLSFLCFILYLVLTLKASNPEGVRFDKQLPNAPVDPAFHGVQHGRPVNDEFDEDAPDFTPLSRNR